MKAFYSFGWCILISNLLFAPSFHSHCSGLFLWPTTAPPWPPRGRPPPCTGSPAPRSLGGTSSWPSLQSCRKKCHWSDSGPGKNFNLAERVLVNILIKGITTQYFSYILAKKRQWIHNTHDKSWSPCPSRCPDQISRRTSAAAGWTRIHCRESQPWCWTGRGWPPWRWAPCPCRSSAALTECVQNGAGSGHPTPTLPL